jgi:trans-2,3-dihydro-3-hydroxyanthranilate isomerase
MFVPELEILKVDVFTSELYMGNPASVVLEADQVDEVQMQRIAFELGSPATVFAMRSRKADLRLRYFSTHSEEPLSGHGTIGAVWCLAQRKAFGEVTGGRQRIETSVGILPFSVEGDIDGPKKIWMTQKRPMFASEGDIKEVASALGTGVESLFHDEFPVWRVSTGLPCLIVPVRSIDVIGRLEPRRDELAALTRELDVAGLYAFSWGVMDQESTAHARFFAPQPGMLEDAASGLPAGALGAYFVENEFIQRDRYESIVIEQGHWMGRPSRIFVKVEKRGPAIRKVEVGGSAVISSTGRLTVP